MVQSELGGTSSPAVSVTFAIELNVAIDQPHPIGASVRQSL